MTVATESAISKTSPRKMNAHSGSFRGAGAISEVELKRRLERVLAQRYLQERMARWRRGTSHAGPQIYKPRMDLYDEPEDPLITAVLELPGVHTNDLRLHIENNFLLIEGRRHSPDAVGDDSMPQDAEENSSDSAARTQLRLGGSTISRNAKVRELRYGQFRRVIELPTGVQASDVQTSLGLGMLTVSWPRNPHGTARVESTSADEDMRNLAELGKRISRSASAP
ncbi:hypothetical protein OBBRIDRAFT_410673 [Obba rivulosa]|uniref:SHSP domain-containing protein n=1 Tax=Obba rivulosa TaxID=1052685 RepID=A0A8E2B112_9APHY|nr:hypothetical protein OBBRIDRAFT_410673 [Obba rivulosa]